MNICGVNEGFVRPSARQWYHLSRMGKLAQRGRYPRSHDDSWRGQEFGGSLKTPSGLPLEAGGPHGCLVLRTNGKHEPTRDQSALPKLPAGTFSRRVGTKVLKHLCIYK